MVPGGRIATAAVSRDVQVNEQPATPQPPAVDATAPTVPTIAPTIADPAVPKVGPDASETVKTEVKDVKPKSVAGLWSYETPGYDYRIQFGDNGKFIYAATRGDGINDDYAPFMAYGKYEIKQSKTSEWVVLVVERENFGDVFKDDKTVLMKLEWEEDRPILSFTHGISRSPKAVRFVLKPGEFEDMNKYLPPAGRRRNLAPVANPTPYW